MRSGKVIGYRVRWTEAGSHGPLGSRVLTTKIGDAKSMAGRLVENGAQDVEIFELRNGTAQTIWRA